MLEDMGMTEFRKLYLEEFAALSDEEFEVAADEEAHESGLKPTLSGGSSDSPFSRFTLHPEKANGLFAVELRVSGGDLDSEKSMSLAVVVSTLNGASFRVSQNQNLIISGVEHKDLQVLWPRLQDIFGDFDYPGTLLDVVSCKGATTCNLGLCDSPALARVLARRLREEAFDQRFVECLAVRISGCPNACSQHPVSPIAFHGMVRKVDGRAVPYYKLLIGGRKAGENSRLASEVGILPAKSLPDFLAAFLKSATLLREENPLGTAESANCWIALAEIEIAKFSRVPTYTENPDYYRDFDSTADFTLDGLGKSECGAGIVDMIESDLGEARMALEHQESSSSLSQVLYLSARALLVVRGSDPTSAEAVFQELRGRFIDTGVVDPAFADIQVLYESLRGSDRAVLDTDLRRVAAFHGHIRELYDAMDSSFNFPLFCSTEAQGPETRKSNVPHSEDLRGTPCPFNFVKAKLLLETLAKGDVLEILLDDGEPIHNVPQSLRSDGHTVLSATKIGNYYSLLVEKG